ncbi:serine protease [Pseudomonas azotoformans]|uniref:Serine protease n=1 Tax=Pseudomonas azotoformans TaxID=47878 RepID=A0A1V2JE03_PSEAZ|nr:S8 family peptidase [Pseudomonas azotoformans]OIN43424.1 serine protease [Pseudomonas azotoformans]ONH43594.1 serine protease [Pseudomonas azotoformans]SDO45648.1 Subtilase family protein [Pseudomonas azotoformans]
MSHKPVISSLRLVLLTLPLLLLGCVTPPSSKPAEPDTQRFETLEYLAQKALPIVKASALYARGGTGQGVKVALIDSGLNQDLPEFYGRVADPGYDFVQHQPGTLDIKGHGTQMAGILAANKNDQGIHGIAFNAQLIPMRFGDDQEPFYFDREIAQAWTLAHTKGARIFSNSWANPIEANTNEVPIYERLMGDSLDVAKKLVAEGAVFVFSTGNEVKREPLAEPGLPALVPELEKGWIAVMALKSDGTTINLKSNYCGLAARWCIAVPGGDGGAGLLTTHKDGGYGPTAGTSPAAALVSGALAALQSRFPEMTPQQVRDRLLSTANRTGIYANSEAYGRGLMDLDAASRL